MNNLEWLYEHDDEFAYHVDNWVIDDGYGSSETWKMAREWLMATHDDDSKAQSKTEPNLSEQSESLSGETDSREKLEADVRKCYMYTVSTAMWPPSANKHADMVSVSIETVLEWLDRQAAITKRDTLHDNPTCSGSSTCAANRPISESADRETPDTAGIGASKCDIRDFDGEHAEGRSTEVGKTSASPRQSDGMDSREKLLEDANALAIDYWDRKRTWGEANDLKREVIALLDRQAAITERECRQREYAEGDVYRKVYTKSHIDEMIRDAKRELELQRERNTELTAERDNLEVNNLQLHTLAGEQAAMIDELQASLDSAKRAIAKAGGTWTEHEDGTVAVVFAPDVDKLKAERDKWRKRALEAESKGAIQRLNSLRNTLRRDWHTDTVWNDALSVYSLRVDPDVLHPIPGFTRNEVYLSSMLASRRLTTLERDEIIGDLTAEVEKLNAERDKLREELRIEREAVEACEGCDKVNDLQAKLDALKRAVSDAGGMWMEEGGTVSAAFAPDVDELRAERDYWKDQVHRCVIAAVEPGGYTAGVMGYPRDGGYIAPYLLVTDAIDSLKDFYADAKREVAKYQEVVDNQNEVIGDLKAERDQFEDYAYRVETERDKYREKFGKALDFAGEIGRCGCFAPDSLVEGMKCPKCGSEIEGALFGGSLGWRD